MIAKKLLEELENIPELGESPVRAFTKEVEAIVNNEIQPLRYKLWELAKKFKEANPGYTSDDLPEATRALDGIIGDVATIIDVLNDKARDKGAYKKVMKALGYNV